MTVFKPKGAAYPEFAKPAIESQRDTVQIGEGNTTGTVTFTLDGEYDSPPVVSTGEELESTSGGAATTQVDRAEITTRSTTTVEVEVQLDSAPGTGETATVGVGITVTGA